MPVIVQNDSHEEKKVYIQLGDRMINPSLKPNTFNTFLIK